MESKYFIFLKYVYNHKQSILLINKTTKRTSQAYKPAEAGWLKYTGSINNDLDGGLPLTLGARNYYYYIEDGSEYVAFLINPFALKNHVGSDAFVNSSPKYPDKKIALEKLARSLDENDNPVLMIVKLKC